MTFSKGYNDYLLELRHHLFADASVEEIMRNIHKSHRSKRFIALYLAKDKKTFDHYYEKRKELGLESIFNQLISALLHETDKNLMRKFKVKELGINKEMISFPCSNHERDQIRKDFNSIMLYLFKKKMRRIKKMGR